MKVSVIPSRHHSVRLGEWKVLAVVYQDESDTPWYVLDVLQSKPAVIRGEYVAAITGS
jgi:hypothetical protein